MALTYSKDLRITSRNTKSGYTQYLYQVQLSKVLLFKIWFGQEFQVAFTLSK